MRTNSVKFIIQESDVTYYAWWTICRDFTRSKMIEKYIGSPYHQQLIVFQNGDAKWAADLEVWHRYGETLLQKIKKGVFPLQALVNDHIAHGSRVVKLCNQLKNQDLSGLTNKQLSEWIKKTLAHYLPLNEAGFVVVTSDLEHTLFTNLLKETLEKINVPHEQVQPYLNTLMMNDRKNLPWEELRNLLKLAIKYPSLNDLKKTTAFQKHVNKYQWVNFGYKGPVWNARDFLNRVKSIKNQHPSLKTTLREHEHFLDDIKKRRIMLEKQLHLSAKERKLFEIARTFSYLKNYRVDIRHYFCFTSYSVISELSRRFNIPVKWLEYANEKEIHQILAGKKPYVKKVLAREQFHAELWEGRGDSIILTKKQLEKLLKKIIMEEKYKESDTLQGQAAFLGKVTGTVRIVSGPKDNHKVKRGDILVAIYTDPNLLPAMERAAAFVTDQGGITSHAAIVAREMKKPCVIGTKYATRILKDGDKVLVDAGNGIVKLFH